MFKNLSKVKRKVVNNKLFKNLSNKYGIYFIFMKRNIFKIKTIYMIGTFFYLLSLNHIDGFAMECFSLGGVDCLFMIAKLVLYSSIFFSFSIFLILFKNYKKINLIYILIIFLLFILIDHNNGIIKHGLYNFVGLVLMTSLLFIFLCFIHLLINLLKKRNYLSLILIFSFFFIIFISIKRFKSTHFSCIDWDKGLNNTYIDNSKKYPCKINIPKPHSCYLTDIGPFFDFTSKYRPTCSDYKLISEGQKSFLKYYQYRLNYSNISTNTHFGFPLTNTEEFNPIYFGSLHKQGQKEFDVTVNQNIILMDLYNKNKDKYYPNQLRPEVEVIFKENQGNIRINIQRNETLIKERKNKISKINQMYKNILIIFLDTVSRCHFIRKLPKTMKFLNDFMKYETNPSKKSMTVFQFFKYNSLGTYTDPNLRAIYYGSTFKENGTHFGEYFKESGYITGRANSYCDKEPVNDDVASSSIIHHIFDHEGLSLGCMKPFYDGALFSNLNCLVKKCLFGKDLNEYAFEYLESFWEAYIDQNKMFLYQSIDGHEPTGQVIGYFDNILYKYLSKFYEKGYLKQTPIILFSDHGQHLNGPLYLFDSQDFYYERTLPGLFLILPNDEKLYKNNLYDKIKLNQQTLITGFDIYNTLVHLAFGWNKHKVDKYKVKYGESLLTKINYKTRYCESKLFGSLLTKRVCNCIKN